MRAWKPSEAGSWMGERPRPQSRLLAGPLGSWSSPRCCGSTHSGLGLAYPGAWIFSLPLWQLCLRHILFPGVCQECLACF